MQAHCRHLLHAPALLAVLVLGAPLAWAQAPPAAAPPYPYPYPPPYPYPYPPPPYYAPPAPSAPPPAAPAPSGPAVISPWDPDSPPPQGYTVSSKSNGGLIGGGVAILTSFWLTSVIGAVSAAKNEEEAGIDGDGVEAGDWTPLYIPIVGPFITINSVDAGSDGGAVLAVDGALQTVGAFMIVWGIIDRRYTAVRYGGGSRGIEISPIAGGSVRGFSLRGSF